MFLQAPGISEVAEVKQKTFPSNSANVLKALKWLLTGSRSREGTPGLFLLLCSGTGLPGGKLQNYRFSVCVCMFFLPLFTSVTELFSTLMLDPLLRKSGEGKG